MKIITINKPNEIKSKWVYNSIIKSLKFGAKKDEIMLQCGFVAPNNILNDISNAFRLLKIKANKQVNPPDLSNI